MALIATPPTTKPSFSPLRRRKHPTAYKIPRHCVALFHKPFNSSVLEKPIFRSTPIAKSASVPMPEESTSGKNLSSDALFHKPFNCSVFHQECSVFHPEKPRSRLTPIARAASVPVPEKCTFGRILKPNSIFNKPFNYSVFHQECSVFHREKPRFRLTPIARSSSVSVPEEGTFGRILLSDVVVKRKRNVYWGREWNAMDMATLGTVMAMHLLCFVAPFVFNWGAFWVAVGLYVVTGLFGITLSYHRNLSHRSFKLPKWLEYLFAYCGAQTLQGNPIDWVSTHRYHHQFCDSEKDPHSPTEGFWFSHMSWIFDTNAVEQRCGKPNNVGDLEKQPFYRFLKNTYLVHPIALGALLYAMGGFPYIVWGMGVRIVWVYHITWLVNSACHVWGKQAWNTGDLSRNNWWVAVLAFGEGWHNNHHAFEYSARHGLEWWQVDMTWYVVRFLEAIGLASDVKLPNAVHKKRMAFASEI